MLSAFARAFRTPDLRKKILFTLAIMALFRLGSHIPAPGIDYTLVEACQAAATQGATTALGFANLFSGGALLQLSIFALGIMPYITAAIIVQLLTVVIPRFEALKKEGQSGQAKMTQYTRYLTIGLAVLQSSTLVTFARNPSSLFGTQSCTTVMPNDGTVTILIMVLTMTAGTGLIMWLGEQITERGIGNGMSLLIFTAIAAGFPASLGAIWTEKGWTTFALVIAIGLVIMTMVVFVEQSQRRIPVQYAKRMIGRRQYGGTSTYIPLKLNMANVIPIIFASSILTLPTLIAGFNRPNDGSVPPDWVTWIDTYLGFGTNQTHWIYMLLYVALIIFFTFFYVSVTFDPVDVAENMKKYGGFIPGIRAGRPTAEYLSYVITRITTPGAIYLAGLALIPLIAFNLLNTSTDFPFGGASILIIVGVGLQTVKQIESQLQQHDYEGFLR
ncbi:preprotein translocase subunit SecY [Ornithinimicrobium sp. Arc0846-15]|nr:preprotein translocase subunit SecY [Ornithinimicrobium laminariae]